MLLLPLALFAALVEGAIPAVLGAGVRRWAPEGLDRNELGGFLGRGSGAVVVTGFQEASDLERDPPPSGPQRQVGDPAVEERGDEEQSDGHLGRRATLVVLGSVSAPWAQPDRAPYLLSALRAVEEACHPRSLPRAGELAV